MIGILRCLKGTTNTQLVAKGLLNIGQGLFYPPNVKGWDGGRAWINSSTLLGRANLIADILENDATRFDGKSLSEYLESHDVRTTDQAIEHFEQCLLAVRLTTRISPSFDNPSTHIGVTRNNNCVRFCMPSLPFPIASSGDSSNDNAVFHEPKSTKFFTHLDWRCCRDRCRCGFANCFAHAAGEANDASDERILVVVQMSGGNDGLNTIVPYADDDYRSARPKLAIPTSDVLKCDDDIGFHPSMTGVYDLLQDGQFAAVRSVGYEQPNRSHFESMDIWHTCRRKDEPRPDGWLGRFLDKQPSVAGGDVPALHLGHEQQPFAIASTNVRVPTVKELAEFQLRGNDKQSLRLLLKKAARQQKPSTMNCSAFCNPAPRRRSRRAERVTEAAQRYRSDVKYPETELGNKLRVVAQLIDAGLTTRIYYVQHDGFDTHAQQSQTHSILLRQWSDAVSALVRDLEAHDHGKRVCVMTFSEFGRRVAENASEGTDHGAAGPMFLCGGGVKAGIVGKRPNLTDLQDGDLKHEYDFRQVYASVLKDWLGTDPTPILGDTYEPLPLFV